MRQLQSMERHAISNALGIAPEHTAITQLSLLLNGLSTISARESSVTIPVPQHLVRSDITRVFDQLPHIQIAGDHIRVLATRTTKPAAEPLAALSAPQRDILPAPQDTQQVSHAQDTKRVAHKRETPVQRVSTHSSSPVGELGLIRASEVVEALGVSTGEIPHYPTVVQKLGDALSYERPVPTTRSRTDGVLYITVPSLGDATSLLEGLGFDRTRSSSGSVWSGLRFQRVCQRTETKSSASLALTRSGCDITIGLGEPLTESFSVAPTSFQRTIRAQED
jgi:hypothetical protein